MDRRRFFQNLILIFFSVGLLLLGSNGVRAGIYDGGLLTDADHDFSFEGDGSKWTYTSAGATFGSTTEKRERAKSLKYGTQTTSVSGRTVVSSKVTGITAGSKYSGSVWMMCTSETYNDVHIKLAIVWYKSDATSISESTQDSVDKLTPSARSSWQQQKYENVTAPADAAQAELKIYLWRSGGTNRIVYLDDARFVAGEEAEVNIIIREWRELY